MEEKGSIIMITGIRALALAAVLSVIGTLPAEAQTHTVLHLFAGPPTDGAFPASDA
jgi:hypothetical protein